MSVLSKQNLLSPIVYVQDSGIVSGKEPLHNWGYILCQCSWMNYGVTFMNHLSGASKANWTCLTLQFLQQTRWWYFEGNPNIALSKLHSLADQDKWRHWQSFTKVYPVKNPFTGPSCVQFYSQKCSSTEMKPSLQCWRSSSSTSGSVEQCSKPFYHSIILVGS